MVEQAIKRRIRVVHDCAHIGSVWRDYATGGGEWVPVMSFLGTEEYGEHDLVDDLALQQDATGQAVHMITPWNERLLHHQRPAPQE